VTGTGDNNIGRVWSLGSTRLFLSGGHTGPITNVFYSHSGNNIHRRSKMERYGCGSLSVTKYLVSCLTRKCLETSVDMIVWTANDERLQYLRISICCIDGSGVLAANHRVWNPRNGRIDLSAKYIRFYRNALTGVSMQRSMLIIADGGTNRPIRWIRWSHHLVGRDAGQIISQHSTPPEPTSFAVKQSSHRDCMCWMSSVGWNVQSDGESFAVTSRLVDCCCLPLQAQFVSVVPTEQYFFRRITMRLLDVHWNALVENRV
jgi:hypothetical protein